MTSTPIQATGVVLIAVALVLVFRMVLVRALGGRGNDSIVDTVMEPLAGIYGMLLAFLVGGAADRVLERRTAVRQEVEAFQRVVAVVRHMPAPLDTQLHVMLRGYATAELAARRGFQSEDRSNALLNDMWLALAGFEPTRTSQQMLQSEAMAELRTLREQRRIAASANRPAHGPMIWSVLLLGAVLLISCCAVAGVADPHAPFYLSALSALIAITLYVFYALTRPLNLLSLQQITRLLQ